MSTIDPIILALLVPAVLGLVEFAKSLGIAGRLLMLISVVLGAGLTTAAMLLPPGTMQIVFTGILGGLAASGFYDFGKIISPSK